ncbi:MAG: hypothetical protein SVS85_00025 [Candidatus Nanohaloarchaea archaeon]|nr:hypothetical protein [Candidatus Nanohaloarchaea archaeon]
MRKAQFSGLRVMIVVLMVFSISLFVAIKVLGAYQAATQGIFTGVAQEVVNEGVSALYLFDYVSVVLVVGFGIMSIASSLYIRSHPMFYLASMLLNALNAFVAAMVTNAFDKVATSSAFSTIAGNLPYTVQIIRNLPVIMVVLGLVSGVVMYSGLSMRGTEVRY